MSQHSVSDSLELDAALARILLETSDPRASWFALTEGDRLFSAGDPADTLYVLRSGRLGVFMPQTDQPAQFVGIIRPGGPAGEMSLMAATAHTSNVVALRDSEVIALPRDAFFEIVREHPALMTEMARVMIQRTRRQSGNEAPTVFGFISARPAPIRAYVQSIADAIEATGYRVRVIDHSDMASAAEWFSRVEVAHDFVLYVAEANDAVWANLCARQVDRLFIVGDPASRPPSTPVQRNGDRELVRQLTDLILLSSTPVPQRPSCKPWLEAMEPGRWFHCQEGLTSDAERIARIITGASVGVLLSGGGARAYAHLGVLRALTNANIPIDFIGGVSMGAVIGAGHGLGWSQTELEQRIHASFVKSDPLSDIALPIIALTRAGKLGRLLSDNFGDARIEDMSLPFFAASANLTTGRMEVHRTGRLWDALRASVAIPGVIPPLVKNGQVLVDGAVIGNFPSEVMRQINRGPMIGSDVTQARGVDAGQLADPPSWWRWISSGAWKQGPPIVSILMRSATLSTSAELSRARAETDVLILPPADGVEIRQWKLFEPTIVSGQLATEAALANLEQPLQDLRRVPAKPAPATAPLETISAPVSPLRTALARLLPQRRPTPDI